MKTHLLFSTLLLASATACSQASQDQAPIGNHVPAGANQAAVAQSQVYSAFEVSWGRPSVKDVAARTRGVAEVMLGERLPEHSLETELAASNAPGRLTFGAALGSAQADFLGEYRHGADELVLDNRKLGSDISGADIGEAAALNRCADALQHLADAGVLDRALFDMSTAVMTKTLQGEGTSDTSDLRESVVSYDFMLRQQLNGVPFVNAGVRISIHRSGAIQSIRIGGARAAAKSEAGVLQPSPPGYTFRAKLDTKYYGGRFAQEYPQGEIRSEGVKYMLPKSVDPEAGQKQVIEPLYVFQYSNHDGVYAGRRRYVGYSLSNPSAPAVDLETVAPPAQEITTPRPTSTTPNTDTPTSPVGQ
jgi:hypothetical protein